MSLDRHSSGKLLPPTEDDIFGKERLKSDIELGMLQMQILWIISRKSTHGYEIMKELGKLKGTKITQGTLYPALQKLELHGLIKGGREGRRIIYDVTEKGQKTVNRICREFAHTFFGIFCDFVCNKCLSIRNAKR